jgi:hypothetical protein
MNNNTTNVEEKGVAIYCASSDRIRIVYKEFAYEVGRLLAQKGVPVINGGGRMGLMASVTEGAVSAGGNVVGVLPKFMLERGWNHPALSDTVCTADMHDRKNTIARMSRGAIVLPGGIGTFDEMFEILTWRQLELYTGPLVIANVDGYYDKLLQFLAYVDSEHFMRPGAPAKLWRVALTPEEAVEMVLSPADVIVDDYTKGKF